MKFDFQKYFTLGTLKVNKGLIRCERMNAWFMLFEETKSIFRLQSVKLDFLRGSFILGVNNLKVLMVLQSVPDFSFGCFFRKNV